MSEQEQLVTGPGELVQELLSVLRGTSITELEIEWQGVRVRIQRDASAEGRAEALVGAGALPAGEARPEDGLIVVTSAHVGVFHRDPEAQLPSVGDEVAAGAKIGEVEALRIRNPVMVPVEGVLSALLVEDEEPVEYGQPLALLRPRRATEGDAEAEP